MSSLKYLAAKQEQAVVFVFFYQIVEAGFCLTEGAYTKPTICWIIVVV